MASAGKPFIGLVPPQDKRPRSAFFSPFGIRTILRDNFTLTTWLCLGAATQSLLFLALGRPALLPAALLLAYRTLTAYAMSLGYLHNSYMDDVLLRKASAQFPDSEGRFSAKAADDEVVVLLIGTRCNHPLGVLAPGFKDIGGMFVQMAKDCEEHAEEFGFLGMTSWINSGGRETNNEILVVGYFRTPDGLHSFAHSKYHTDAWNWWNANQRTHPHLSIYHENYHVPKGHWETVYINSHVSHLGSASFKTFDQATGTEEWASPMVDASKGLLRTSKGRMSTGKGDENESFKQVY